MATFDEELMLDEQENQRELAFIRQRLPIDLKHHYSDNDILWIMDAIVDYYYDSGILESDADEIDIDMEAVANYVCELAKKEKVDNFYPEEMLFIVQADLDFQEQNV